MKKLFILSTVLFICLGINMSSFGDGGEPSLGFLALEGTAKRYYQVNIGWDKVPDSSTELIEVLKNVGGHQLFAMHQYPFSRVVAVSAANTGKFLTEINKCCETREISSLMNFKLVITNIDPLKKDSCYPMVFKAEPNVSKIFDVNSDFEFNDDYNLLDDDFINRTIAQDYNSTPEEKSRRRECLLNGNEYLFHWLLDYGVPYGEGYDGVYFPFSNASIEVKDSGTLQFAGGLFKFENTPEGITLDEHKQGAKIIY